MRYMVVMERTRNGYGAHVPDLPGCIAAGETREETLELIQGAIEMHLESLQEQGLPVPEPAATSEYVEVDAA